MHYEQSAARRNEREREQREQREQRTENREHDSRGCLYTSAMDMRKGFFMTRSRLEGLYSLMHSANVGPQVPLHSDNGPSELRTIKFSPPRPLTGT